MAKDPKWKQEFKQRMKAQLKEFAKAKESPKHLTKWEYTNGRVDIISPSYKFVLHGDASGIAISRPLIAKLSTVGFQREMEDTMVKIWAAPPEIGSAPNR